MTEVKNNLRKLLVLIVVPVVWFVVMPAVYVECVYKTVKEIFLAIDNGR